MVRMPPCHGGGRGFESHPGRHFASVAQLVEQRTENPCVSGSIPELGIEKKIRYYGILAQLVEHLTFNQVVRGSNPRCLIGLK